MAKKNQIPEVLARIIRLAESGDVGPDFEDDGPIDTEAGEVEVGELNMFEKSARSVFRDLRQQMIKAEQAFDGGDNERAKHLEQLNDWLGVTSKIMWLSVSERIESRYYDSKKWSGLKIRAGSKIVATPSKLVVTDLLGLAIIESIFGGREVPKHDCANCEDYDKCNLPEKTPREEKNGSRAGHH